MDRISPSQLKQRMLQAQRQAEQRFKQEVRKAEQRAKQEADKVNRENKRIIDEHNRKFQREVDRVNRQNRAKIDAQNRKAETHNKKVISDINRQLRSQSSAVRYSEPEQRLADRVYTAVGRRDPREYDVFLSYARIDGGEIASQLKDSLEKIGVSVWFDEVAIVPGRSQSLQMDAGLQKARAGIVLLTAAYLTGRFWTERELGALLGKDILVPVLHKVTFDDVRQYSGILPDLAGFTTDHDAIDDIAKKIAAAVVPE